MKSYVIRARLKDRKDRDTFTYWKNDTSVNEYGKIYNPSSSADDEKNLVFYSYTNAELFCKMLIDTEQRVRTFEIIAVDDFSVVLELKGKNLIKKRKLPKFIKE